MTPRVLALIGLVSQLLVPLLLWGLFLLDPPFNPWLGAGVAGVAASVLGLVAAIRAREMPTLTWLGGIGAVIGGIGWGSWLVVGVLSSPDDPVINITGLLVVPGFVLGVIGLALSFWRGPRPRFHTTGALWFGLAQAALLASGYLLLVAEVYLVAQFLPAAQLLLTAGQLVRAHLTHPQPHRIPRFLALVGGYLLLSNLLVSILGVGYLVLIAGTVVTLVGGALELGHRGRREAAPGHS